MTWGPRLDSPDVLQNVTACGIERRKLFLDNRDRGDFLRRVAALTEVRTRIKVFGEEGLHEKLHAAQSHLDHIRQESTAMIRRAQAGRLLYVP